MHHQGIRLYPDLASPQQESDGVMPPVTQTPLKRKLPGKFDDASEESTGKFNLEKLSSSERAQLAYELGKFEHETYRPYVRLTEENSLDTLLSADVNSEVDEKCKTPFAFLCGIAGLHQSSYKISVGGNIQNKLHKALESTVNLSALNVTLPVRFREAVLLYALTGSRVALQILASGGAHASYKVVKSWLASLGSTVSPVQYGDIIVAFNNNQVLQRRWNVRLKTEVRCNIVTVNAVFHLGEESLLPICPSLKPPEGNVTCLSLMSRSTPSIHGSGSWGETGTL